MGIFKGAGKTGTIKAIHDLFCLFSLDSCDKQGPAPGGQAFNYCNELLDTLARAVNNLWQYIPETPVMIKTGPFHLLVRECLKLLDTCFNFKAAIF